MYMYINSIEHLHHAAILTHTQWRHVDFNACAGAGRSTDGLPVVVAMVTSQNLLISQLQEAISSNSLMIQASSQINANIVFS